MIFFIRDTAHQTLDRDTIQEQTWMHTRKYTLSGGFLRQAFLEVGRHCQG